MVDVVTSAVFQREDSLMVPLRDMDTYLRHFAVISSIARSNLGGCVTDHDARQRARRKSFSIEKHTATLSMILQG